MVFPSFKSVQPYKFHQSGFTLIEILVVIFIIGIALGAVGISIGAATKDSRLITESSRIVDWINQTRNIAIISNKTFRLSIDEPDLLIVQDYYEDIESENEWIESSAVDKSRYVISGGVETEWLFEDDETSEIFIYPDSSYTPFRLVLSLGDDDTLTILGQGISPPKLNTDEEDE